MGLNKPLLAYDLGKLPPQAVDAEKSLLGCLMAMPEAIEKVCGTIKSESFYKEEHKILFEAIYGLYQKMQPIDFVIVVQTLSSQGLLETVGGPLYLTELINNHSFSYHYERHARIIQQKYIQRELIRIGHEIQVRAYDETVDLVEHLSFAQSAVENIDKFIINEGKETFDVAKETISEIEQDCKDHSEGRMNGINCGLGFLNTATGGWKKGAFIILGARPGEGKTTHAINFALSAARHGVWVNFYSYEMAATELFKIIMAGQSNVNRSRIRDGRLDNDDWAMINSNMAEIENLPILWYDDPDITISQIRSNTRKNKLRGKCELVIIDYIQQMPPESKSMNREQQISEISRSCKKTAMSNQIPVIALAQLNRDVDKRASPEVYNSDLRESGSLEQDADLIMFLYSEKDEQGLPITRYIKISKQRNGKVGIGEYTVDAQMTKVFDVENEYSSIPPDERYEKF